MTCLFPHLSRLRLVACLALLAGLGACGTHPSHRTTAHYSPSRYYPPPGPASDPWGPYIHEASARFTVPENWIRRVMRQESGGQEDVISWAGAMGLMQVMPDTYDGLRQRYGLGDDPFEPRNNILAGAAYLREMYERFGSPAFLAAYNAGPSRVDRYLNNGTPLPAETVNYVASIAPLLGTEMAMSGPLAVYAGGGGYAPRMAARATADGCDPDAAYNPAGPCTPLRPAVVQTVAVATAPYKMQDCDPDAAYDPTRPCQPTSVVAQAAVSRSVAIPPERFAAATGRPVQDCDPDTAYDPTRQCRPAPVVARPAITQPAATPPERFIATARPLQERMAEPVAFSAGPPPGRWMIQVGAFATLTIAEAAAERARTVAPDLLRFAKIELPATAPLGTQVAFRARLSGLSASAAADACARLNNRGTACITVPPRQGSF
jgi:D-alanyl-D-alanine carboxypeptidase